MNEKSVIESSHEVPSAPVTIEDRFRAPDGALDYLSAQRRLLELQSRGDNISVPEIEEAISIVRLIRRTNTGPKQTAKPKGKKGSHDLSLDDLA
ncbi:MAG: hypothetical protein IPK54_10200 [Dokdonella sp.]|uniref:hypothetical protein n=1 Tax=Dokdonella sp. TaxID=2291710 RepID=UPI0025C5895C|nr:hypothetical protein [Dokdonella sp.]MBK8123903.1 hypothetical protein [Dokdonella sp.]